MASQNISVGSEKKFGKIALIVTYFGELPFWFPAFQLSCKHNPDIQWFIFSDADSPIDCPKNITFVPFSVEDFCRLASEKLQTDIDLSADFFYKICDFKPAFGLIYEDYLNPFDFWGHCDIDIIWGQIKDYITKDLLEKYDIITSRPNRISGHFCLYRNNEKISRIFLQMHVTGRLLQRTYSYERLDEEHFSNYLHWLIKPSFLSTVKQFFTGKPFVPKIYWERVLTTSGRHQRALMNNKGSCCRWKKGKVCHIDGTEMMYLHFHILKKMPSFTQCDIKKNNELFCLSTNGIKSSSPA